MLYRGIYIVGMSNNIRDYIELWTVTLEDSLTLSEEQAITNSCPYYEHLTPVLELTDEGRLRPSWRLNLIKIDEV